MKRINLVFFFFAILLSGCHSFYRIDTDELQSLTENDVVQIKTESGEVIEINDIWNANLSDNPEELVFPKINFTKYEAESTRIVIPLNEIKEIRIKRVDVQKSIFTPIFLAIGLALAFVLSGATFAG